MFIGFSWTSSADKKLGRFSTACLALKGPPVDNCVRHLPTSQLASWTGLAPGPTALATIGNSQSKRKMGAGSAKTHLIFLNRALPQNTADIRKHPPIELPQPTAEAARSEPFLWTALGFRYVQASTPQCWAA